MTRFTRRLSNENFHLANVDSLTDLPNRRQFFHRLSVLAEQAKTADRRFVVGVLDLDGFKAVNDLYGHGVGDRVLKETGQRLLELSDDTQFIARLGGDEFGIIVDAGLDPGAVLAVGSRSSMSGRRSWSASKRSRDGIIPSSAMSLLTSSFRSPSVPS